MPGHRDSSFDPQRHNVDAFARLYVKHGGELNLLRIILAGISMGGYIALKPDPISALVLSNTKAEADTDEIVARRKAQIANIKRHGLAHFVHTGAPKRLSPSVLEKRPWVLDCIKMMNLTTVSAEANSATLEAMAGRADETGTLATINVPVLITTGSNDIFIPHASAAVLQAWIRESRLHVIADTGHVSNLENPTEYNRVAESFLSNPTVQSEMSDQGGARAPGGAS